MPVTTRTPRTAKTGSITSSEARDLRSKINESIFYKQKLEKEFRGNKHMLYLLLIVNLAMFAFIVGVIIRYIIT